MIQFLRAPAALLSVAAVFAVAAPADAAATCTYTGAQLVCTTSDPGQTGTDSYGTGSYGTGGSTDSYGTGSYGTGSSVDSYGTGSSSE